MASTETFGKQVLHSVERTLNHELREPESEAHKLTSRLADTLMKKLIKVSTGLFVLFFLFAGLVDALNQWFDVPIWTGCFAFAFLGGLVLSLMHVKEPK
jgi:hypothetical protein